MPQILLLIMQGVGRFSGSIFLVENHIKVICVSRALRGGCKKEVKPLAFSRMDQLTWTDPRPHFLLSGPHEEGISLWQALRPLQQCFPTILARLFLMLNLNPSTLCSGLPLVECKWGTAAPAQALTSAISQDDPVRQARVIRPSWCISAHVSIPCSGPKWAWWAVGGCRSETCSLRGLSPDIVQGSQTNRFTLKLMASEVSVFRAIELELVMVSRILGFNIYNIYLGGKAADDERVLLSDLLEVHSWLGVKPDGLRILRAELLPVSSWLYEGPSCLTLDDPAFREQFRNS